MKILIAEDDFTSRLLLQELLKHHGSCHVAVNGKEAVEAVRLAFEIGEPYDLVCLDIMMPEMDGQQALKEIRALEESKGTWANKKMKIMMTSALADMKNVSEAHQNLCDAYLLKPIYKSKLLDKLHSLKLIE